MTFRTRVALVASIAVGVAVIALSIAAYFVLSRVLRGEIDESLRSRAAAVMRETHLDRPELAVAPGLAGEVPGQQDGFYFHLVASGSTEATPSVIPGMPVPPIAGATAVAAGEEDEIFSSTTVDDGHFRVYVVQVRSGLALQVARNVGEVDDYLTSAARQLGVLGLVGGGVAAALVWLTARSMLRPLESLTAAVEHAAATQNLQARICSDRADEIGRLSRSVDTLLEVLDGSLQAQRQLVADASHELRTPLTILRTNVEVLARSEPQSLGAADRDALVHALVNQIEEVTDLLHDLTDLAREDNPPEASRLVRLDLLVGDTVERIVPRASDRDVELTLNLRPCTVLGRPDSLERATANILDNAVKWSPPGGRVEVTVSEAGDVAVRDHGPGVSIEDLPHVFERFYRGESSQAIPGTGLGLAIVHKVVAAHGGSADLQNAPGGGAIARMRLPTAAAAGHRTLVQGRGPLAE